MERGTPYQTNIFRHKRSVKNRKLFCKRPNWTHSEFAKRCDCPQDFHNEFCECAACHDTWTKRGAYIDHVLLQTPRGAGMLCGRSRSRGRHGASFMARSRTWRARYHDRLRTHRTHCGILRAVAIFWQIQNASIRPLQNKLSVFYRHACAGKC